MTVTAEHLYKAADETVERTIAPTYEAVKKAADISRQATDPYCEKGEQMKLLIEQFLENCRTLVILAQTVSSAWYWVPPITGERPRRPMPGGKVSCL